MTWLWLSLAGGLGAWLRFRTDSAIRSRRSGPIPIGTFTINMIGSFLLGALTAWSHVHPTEHPLKTIIGTGFLGGFTTFSTAMVELVNLAEARQLRAAITLGVGMLVVGVAAAALGMVVGGAL